MAEQSEPQLVLSFVVSPWKSSRLLSPLTGPLKSSRSHWLNSGDWSRQLTVRFSGFTTLQCIITWFTLRHRSICFPLVRSLSYAPHDVASGHGIRAVFLRDKCFSGSLAWDLAFKKAFRLMGMWLTSRSKWMSSFLMFTYTRGVYRVSWLI